MLNEDSITTNWDQTQSPSHVRPDYSKYNFANIPGTILNHFAIPTRHQLPSNVLLDSLPTKKVLFLLIDAFGWNLFQQFADTSTVLRRFLNEGVVSQLTSQFPSTTTAHVTTMHTNQPVGQHGMFEWNYYEPRVDAVISPLLYSFSGDSVRGTLRAVDVDPFSIFPRQSMYPILTRHEIASYVFANQAYAASPYNQAITGGATHKIAHSDFGQALDQLAEAVLHENGRAYYYLYWGDLDALCHVHGPESQEARQELWSILDAIESRLLQPLSAASDTLLLIGADHGQDKIDPNKTIYLNQLIPGISRLFRTTKNGWPIVPGGSCRSFFLYLKEEELRSGHELLTRKLDGVAQVMLVEHLIEQGYFGPQVSDTFLARAGNIVIVPNQGETVWWHVPGKFEVGYKGFHGGLSQDEMLIPLLALPL